MSSVKGDYCNVGMFEPSSRTNDAIAEMNRIIDMANLLERILMVVPFFQMFAGRKSFAGVSTASAGYQVSTSDWNTFSDAIKGVEGIKRKKLEQVAFTASYSSIGEERKFWECVYNAL
jgi:hypothetical protein